MAEELVVKVRTKGMKGLDRNMYKNCINPHDANLLVLVFQDLITMFNIPFWKAVALMKQEEKIYPFSP